MVWQNKNLNFLLNPKKKETLKQCLALTNPVVGIVNLKNSQGPFRHNPPLCLSDGNFWHAGFMSKYALVTFYIEFMMAVLLIGTRLPKKD